MTDIDMHELRMTIGQNSMTISDAIDEKVLRRLTEARIPAIKAYRRLIKNGMTPAQARGMMLGVLLGALDSEADNQ